MKARCIRCDSTTCITSPAAMYSLARATARWKPSAPNSLSALRDRRRRLERNRHRLAQPAPQRLQPVARLRVGVALARIGVDDQVDLARQVVDDRQLLGQQQLDVGNVGEPRRVGGALPASFGSMWRTVS